MRKKVASVSLRLGAAAAAVLVTAGCASSTAPTSSTAATSGASGTPPVAIDGWFQQPNLTELDTPSRDYAGFQTVWASKVPGLTADDVAKIKEMAPTIGLSMQLLSIPYTEQVVAGFMSVAEAAGAKVIVTDANAQGDKQVSDVSQLLTQGINALAVLPADDKAIVPAIKQANDAQIPVVVLESPPTGVEFDSLVTHDFFGGGQIGGLALCEAFKNANPKPSVMHVEYPLSALSVDLRIDGYLDAIKGCGLEDVGSGQGITAAEGLQVFTDLLTANPEVRGAWGYYDGVTAGAVKAFEQAGVEGAVVTTHDLGSEQTALEIQQQGSLLKTTAASQTRLEGEVAARLVLLRLLGKDVPEAVLLPIVPVDATNVAEWYETLFGKPLN